jgi:probable phosphoglycerate mutase
MASPVVPADLTATLVLVRHGESTWITEGRFQGRQDPPLSELGQRQAALVARRLAQRDLETPLPIPTGLPAGIWHSPLKRAAETARQIALSQPEPVAITATDALTELAQGEWEGQPHSVVSTRWATELAAWRRTPAQSHAPGGEPLRDAQRRVASGIAEVLGAVPRTREVGSPGSYSPVPGYPGGADQSVLRDPWAVLVAHDGVFRVLLLTLLDVPLERFWSFPFNLCAITVVALREGVATLRAHNLSEHLAPLAAEARAAAEARGDRRGAL